MGYMAERMGPASKDAPAEGATPDGGLEEFRAIYEEQRAQQSRLRHVQQFLTSPLFYDLRQPPLDVTASPEAIAARKREVEYRFSVLSSMLTMMQEERQTLDRTVSADQAAATETGMSRTGVNETEATETQTGDVPEASTRLSPQTNHTADTGASNV